MRLLLRSRRRAGAKIPVRKVWLDCGGCGERAGMMPAHRGDAQGAVFLHDHPWRLTAGGLAPSGEIRNMHSAYGYYGLYIYIRKEMPLIVSRMRKSYLQTQITQTTVFLAFHSGDYDSGLYCPGEVK